MRLLFHRHHSEPEAISEHDEHVSDLDTASGGGGRSRRAPTEGSQHEEKHHEASEVMPMDITRETAAEMQDDGNSSNHLFTFLETMRFTAFYGYTR